LEGSIFPILETVSSSSPMKLSKKPEGLFGLWTPQKTKMANCVGPFFKAFFPSRNIRGVIVVVIIIVVVVVTR